VVAEEKGILSHEPDVRLALHTDRGRAWKYSLCLDCCTMKYDLVIGSLCGMHAILCSACCNNSCVLGKEEGMERRGCARALSSKVVFIAGGRLGDIWGFRWWGSLQDQRMTRWRQHQVTAEPAHAEPPAAGAPGKADRSVQQCQR